MCNRNGIINTVVIHFYLSKATTGTESQENLCFAKRNDAPVHFKDRIPVSLRYSVQAMVVDANAGASVFSGHRNSRQSYLCGGRLCYFYFHHLAKLFFLMTP